MRHIHVMTALILMAISAMTPFYAYAAPRQNDDIRFPDKGSLRTAQKDSIEVEGIPRSYLFYRPPGGGPFPVVILLHGGTQSGRKVWKQTSLPVLAQSERFILIAPDAADGGHWNDGRHKVVSGKPSTADDIKFLERLITVAVNRYAANPNQVFMIGASNGGLMTENFACHKAHLLAGGGYVVAALPVLQQAQCHPDKAVPWIAVNGTEDKFFNFNGGPQNGGGSRGKSDDPIMLSAAESFEFWADNARCDSRVVETRLPNLHKRDNSTVRLDSRGDCFANTTSSFYVIDHGGHMWPGLSSPIAEMIIGRSNMDIDSGTVIWNHFKQMVR
ncbi:MAG: hypothetical protein WDO70_10475 [Alphaproteobacteria bacterium]